MNTNESVIFKELMREMLKNVLREELPKILKEQLQEIKANNSKDLKEVKLLVAGMIKENRKTSPERTDTLSETTKEGLGGLFNRMNKLPKHASRLEKAVGNSVSQLAAPAPIKNILMETAAQMSREAEGQSSMDDLGAGEYLTGDDKWAHVADEMPDTNVVQPDYGPIDEYESNVPDFESSLKARFGK